MTKARTKLRCCMCDNSISEEKRETYRVFECGHPICRTCLTSTKFLSGPCTDCVAEQMKSLPSAASARRSKQVEVLKQKRAREVEEALLNGTYKGYIEIGTKNKPVA
jgi:hypothetical protein